MTNGLVKQLNKKENVNIICNQVAGSKTNTFYRRIYNAAVTKYN